jgi:hypothetical protein
MALGVQVVELIEDVTKLTLMTAFLFVALQFYLKRHPLSWRQPFSPTFTALFSAVTLSGSFGFHFAAAATGTVSLLLVRRRFEAFLVAGSTAVAAILVYITKICRRPGTTIALAKAGRLGFQLSERSHGRYGSLRPRVVHRSDSNLAGMAQRHHVRRHRMSPVRGPVPSCAWSALATNVLGAACLGTIIPLAISFIVTATRDMRTRR